jgi:dipeptidyl aminopeptidase/acylaminoacyl peptidase
VNAIAGLCLFRAAVLSAIFAATGHASQLVIEETLGLVLSGDAPPLAAPAGTIAHTVVAVPEIDPKRFDLAWPAAGDTPALPPPFAGPGTAPAPAWEPMALGVPAASMGGIVFRAFYVAIDRHAEVEVKVKVETNGTCDVFVDGEKAAGKQRWRRGTHRVLLRLPAGSALESLIVEASGGARLTSSLDPRHELASLVEARDVSQVQSVVISPDGRYVAAVVRESGTSARRVEVYDTNVGLRVAPPALSAPATPLQFTADSKRLLLRAGDDLLLWSRETHEIVTILEKEPGLGAVAMSRDGSLAVFASTRGVEEKPSPPRGPKRRTELREKLSDYKTAPHLHVVATESGVRRRLTLPGDATHDAFALHPGGRILIWTRGVPASDRPWFATEVHRLDLASGEDGIVATLRRGFENRPGMSRIALSPDGSRLALLGPRSELGPRGGLEPNPFDPDLLVLELATGKVVNLTMGSSVAPDDAFVFGPDSKTLYFEGTREAAQRIHAVDVTSQPIAIVPHGAVPAEARGAIGACSIAESGGFAVSFSTPDRLPELHAWRSEFSGGTLALARPSRKLAARLVLASPTEEWIEAGEGRRIHAWLYRPRAVEGEKLPLIVYYYGGATPTRLGFSDFHQALVGNGYAVLVVNPRGCGGYGDEWSLAHAGDFGERSGPDVLAALEAILERHPDLDASRIGCYGGSYGGFLTMWLISESKRFHAAISLYGISNVASFFGEGQWGYTYGDQAMGGRYPWSDPEWFAERSPLHRADRIETPLLLLHGEADTNVPPGESEQIFTALKLLGRDVELVRFPGEDHGISSNPEIRTEHREMMIDWFDRKLRGQDAAWSARF